MITLSIGALVDQRTIEVDDPAELDLLRVTQSIHDGWVGDKRAHEIMELKYLTALPPRSSDLIEVWKSKRRQLDEALFREWLDHLASEYKIAVPTTAETA